VHYARNHKSVMDQRLCQALRWSRPTFAPAFKPREIAIVHLSFRTCMRNPGSTAAAQVDAFRTCSADHPKPNRYETTSI
jgi:hypothetical protein